jgi:hypothetical protein
VKFSALSFLCQIERKTQKLALPIQMNRTDRQAVSFFCLGAVLVFFALTFDSDFFFRSKKLSWVEEQARDGGLPNAKATKPHLVVVLVGFRLLKT